MHAFDGPEQNVDCRLVYTNKVTILHFWKLTLDEELWVVSWEQLLKQGVQRFDLQSLQWVVSWEQLLKQAAREVGRHRQRRLHVFMSDDRCH
jgi:hypothetical protein